MRISLHLSENQNEVQKADRKLCRHPFPPFADWRKGENRSLSDLHRGGGQQSDAGGFGHRKTFKPTAFDGYKKKSTARWKTTASGFLIQKSFLRWKKRWRPCLPGMQYCLWMVMTGRSRSEAKAIREAVSRKRIRKKGLRGSKEAFSESVKMNTALIRKRIRNAKMKAEEKQVGRYSATTTALLYLDGVVYLPICEEMRKRLDAFEVDGIEDGGMIEYLTRKKKEGRFPVYQTTERPDRAAQAILEGRVVLLTDNSPEALIFPATLNSLFQTADDYYRNERIVTFLRLIRYVAAFLALALPGLYVAAATFHPQLLPGNLIRSMAEARSGVPFPTAAEVLLMELSFELLREAGLRMPGPAGNTIGIVGGLIVGQAAVSANLVSPITVTVAALTALGSFPYQTKNSPKYSGSGNMESCFWAAALGFWA